jgi:hypothetical protein
MAYDRNMILSTNYTLGDLCITTQMLMQPNLPSDQNTLNNLIALADVLEQLNSSIGPFSVLSGFRTKELQRVLGESGNPISQGLSFHEIGRGVDIYPGTMSISDYFGRILADQNLTNEFAEISIKPGQNSIHLAINVPGDTRTPRITGLDSGSNTYQALSESSIENYIFQAGAGLENVIQVAEENPAISIPLLLGVIGIIYVSLT